MKLQELLKQDLTKLKPQALIIVRQHDDLYTAQNVDYQPELINLGVILLGYYTNPDKVDKLSQLGNCLSVAHYVQAPRTLAYGRDFANNPKFKALPAKPQKHLTGEIQDCTISFSRDLGRYEPYRKFKDLDQFLSQHSVPYVYLYRDQKWSVLRINGRNLSAPADLRKEIAKLLSKKA